MALKTDWTHFNLTFCRETNDCITDRTHKESVISNPESRGRPAQSVSFTHISFNLFFVANTMFKLYFQSWWQGEATQNKSGTDIRRYVSESFIREPRPAYFGFFECSFCTTWGRQLVGKDRRPTKIRNKTLSTSLAITFIDKNVSVLRPSSSYLARQSGRLQGCWPARLDQATPQTDISLIIPSNTPGPVKFIYQSKRYVHSRNSKTV